LSRKRIAAEDPHGLTIERNSLRAICATAKRSALRLTRSTSFFHQAAYGGYMPEITKYVHVNSLGTRANARSDSRKRSLPVRKIVVASSQAVYSEGAGECPEHGMVFPSVRPVEQLRKGDWEVHCPLCSAITRSVRLRRTPRLAGETVYGLTKVDQEKLVLLWGKQTGIPDSSAALLMHIRAAPIDL
jgi:dTDP-L-rhamnose 4-epimerase